MSGDVCLWLYLVHVSNESYLAENLQQLGSTQSENEADITTAFAKFAVVTKELSALMKTLVCVIIAGWNSALLTYQL